MENRSSTTPRAARRRARLTRTLRSAGVLADPAWRAAFADVPRHVFLGRFFVANGAGCWQAADRTDPGWLDQVYADRVLVTQLDVHARLCLTQLGGPAQLRDRANGPVVLGLEWVDFDSQVGAASEVPDVREDGHDGEDDCEQHEPNRS